MTRIRTVYGLECPSQNVFCSRTCKAVTRKQEINKSTESEGSDNEIILVVIADAVYGRITQLLTPAVVYVVRSWVTVASESDAHSYNMRA